MKLTLSWVIAGVLVPCVVLAQEKSESLQSAANDPTASIMSFQLQGFHSFDLHNSSEDSSLLQFRAAIPFTLGQTNHIARLTLPYVTDSPTGQAGLSDTTLFDLMTFDRRWGRFGVGAVALLPTGSDGLSADKWALGPAVGFAKQENWGLWGAFNQNLITVAGDDNRPDVNLSTLQPVFNYTLGNGWSVGTSEMVFVYDWDAGDFSSVPLGLKVSKLNRSRGLPWQWSFSYEHNFDDDAIVAADTVSFTLKLLVPKSR
ncbi:hypothetical protein [Ruegeria sp. HKCCA5426]|uniref:hypothetical protein n=1 Tax=Ruegeria sp. HKCCA5426 TaxID=2682985 RepID=UPI00147BA13E|nr:hypothetical protein [Ruegeria sp. HKCCA5426]